MANLIALTRSLAKARVSEKFSDLTIECRGQNFKVHRFIVHAQSRVLSRLLGGQWVEAVSKNINLDDDDPESISKMLDFFYTATYEDFNPVGQGYAALQADGTIPACAFEVDPNNIPDMGAPLLVHAKLYILGDKYDVPDLRAVAVAGYHDRLPKLWRTRSFVESADLIYKNIPKERDPFKDLVYHTLKAHIDTFVQNPRMLNVFRGMPGLSTDLLVVMVERERVARAENNYCSACEGDMLPCLCQTNRGYRKALHGDENDTNGSRLL